MDVTQTRELFAPLISRPTLEERLLLRPPFKFIHDIVIETIRATGFLKGEFTDDELDGRKTALTKETKIAFIEKLKRLLDDDDDDRIAEIVAAKVVAGREPERTNALLQKLALSAAAANVARSTKSVREPRHRSSSKSKSGGEKKRKKDESTKRKSKSTENDAAKKSTGDGGTRRKSRERTTPSSQTVAAPSPSLSQRDRENAVEREKRRLNRASNVTADLKPTPNAIEATSAAKRVKRSVKPVDDAAAPAARRRVTQSPLNVAERASPSSLKSPLNEDDDEGIGSATPVTRRRGSHAAPPIGGDEDDEARSSRLNIAASTSNDVWIASNEPSDAHARSRPSSESPLQRECGGSSSRDESRPLAASAAASRRRVSAGHSTDEARESSGGTSKGADDSGIADYTTANESSARHVDAAKEPPPPPFGDATIGGDSEGGVLRRPSTAVGRPQTALGRPGTAVARPAPPRVKTRKIADEPAVDTPSAAIGNERGAFIAELGDVEAATVDKNARNGPSAASAAIDAFVVEEEADDMAATAGGAQIGDLEAAAGEHGALVRRIITNARDIEREASGADGDGLALGDPAERRRLAADIERAQSALQAVAQCSQPMARTLELVAEDFDVLLREIEASRRQRADAQQRAAEARAQRGDASAAYAAQLRQLDGEIVQVRAQIVKTMATVLENERRINTLITQT